MLTETMTEKRSDESRPQSERVYRPTVDILEKQDELLVLADMPGVKGSEIDIRFEAGELSIHGPAPARQEGTRYLVQEYGVGDFFRTFRVSEHIDPARISAEYTDGVLVLHLPKVESAKPRAIKVKTN